LIVATAKEAGLARVPYLDQEDLAPEHQDLLTRRISLNRALVNSPDAARCFGKVGQYIRHTSELDPRLRELAILQVGWLARSAYEWSHHVKIGYDFGVSDVDIRALIDDSEGRPNGLEPLAKLVLQGAREMVRDGAMSDASWGGLHETLGNTLMVDLTMTIAFYCAVVRLLATLQIDVEPEYQPYLDRYPLPAGKG